MPAPPAGMYLWSALVGFDVHYPIAAIVAAVVLAVRSRRKAHKPPEDEPR